MLKPTENSYSFFWYYHSWRNTDCHIMEVAVTTLSMTVLSSAVRSLFTWAPYKPDNNWL